MRLVSVAFCLALLATGCASIPEPRALGQVEAVRRSPSVAEARRIAPAAVARGDALADEARRAMDEGGTGAAAAAQLTAERALAAYEVSRAAARTLLAKRRAGEAETRRDALSREVTGIDGELASATSEVSALERELAVLEELELPRPSGPASAEREAARRVAARSLALDARLFCASARLLGGPPAELDPAEQEVAAVERALASPEPTPIDRATRARASCLAILSGVRRGAARAGAAPAAGEPGADQPGADQLSADQPSADALLAALSSAKLSPSRDDRGVVVVLRDAFDGDGLSRRALAQLVELDRVAAAHPRFPVLAVVHDDRAGGAEARGQARAAAAVRGLPSAAGRSRGEWAGAAAPLVDARGAGASRNARLEVVFVAPRHH